LFVTSQQTTTLPLSSPPTLISISKSQNGKKNNLELPHPCIPLHKMILHPVHKKAQTVNPLAFKTMRITATPDNNDRNVNSSISYPLDQKNLSLQLEEQLKLLQNLSIIYKI